MHTYSATNMNFLKRPGPESDLSVADPYWFKADLDPKPGHQGFDDQKLHLKNNSIFFWSKIAVSSYMRKFRREQLQSHAWLTASSIIYDYRRYLRISSYIRKPFLIYDFATAPLWIYKYEDNFICFFISVPGQKNALLALLTTRLHISSSLYF